MGLFNIINSNKKCPKCHQELEWQSKYLEYDTYIIEDLLREIDLNEHMDGEMHTFCDKCKIFMEVDIIKGKEGKIKLRIAYKNSSN